MALTGMQIYKSLPRSNCKECGLPTCMAFAMQVAGKQKALSDCPRISEEAKTTLADASSPPMKLVKIGAQDKKIQLGQETVLFRHEEKFHNPAKVAIRIPASLSQDQALAKVEQVNKLVFERVGKKLRAGLIAIELDGASDPAGRAKALAAASQVPAILMSKDAATMKAAAEGLKGQSPLLYKADASNLDAFAEIAAATASPLAVAGATLEEAADLTQRAKAKGVEEMVLVFDGSNPGDTLRSLTMARRAALKKGVRALGFPAMVDVKAETPELEGIMAASFAAKYSGIVMISGTEPWEVLPVLVSIQDVYTDPQVPNAVEAKLYQIGSPNENSPVLFTTNFSLTYFSVAGEVERSRIPSYIAVVETEGLGVLNAYAGDKISVEKVVKTLTEQKIAEKVKHRKLIIPGLLPIFRAELEETSEWKEVLIGPESASKIPAFLNEVWK